MKCLVFLLLLCVVKCIKKDGQFYIAWIQDGERKIIPIENDYEIPIVRPPTHTLLFKPNRPSPSPLVSWGFFVGNTKINEFDAIDGGYYSITGGVYSQDECFADIDKCWFPENPASYKFMFFTEERSFYETIILRLNTDNLISCARFYAEYLEPFVVDPSSEILPIAVQENDLFAFNEIDFTFGFPVVDNYLDCASPTIVFYVYDNTKVVLIHREQSFEEFPDRCTFSIRLVSAGDHIFQCAIKFGDEDEVIPSQQKLVKTVIETPPDDFLIHSMKNVVNLDENDRLEVCSTIPKFGSNSTGLLSDFIEYFVILNETYFGVNSSNNSTQTNLASLEFNQKICTDVKFNEDTIGEVNLHAVFRNSFGLHGVSEAQKVTVFKTAVPVELHTPEQSKLIDNLNDMYFSFSTIHPKNYGFYDTETEPQRFVKLKLNTAEQLLNKDGGYDVPFTVIANLRFDDNQFTFLEKLKLNTEYHWMITSGFDESHSVDTEVMTFHTTKIDCDASSCQHDSCTIVSVIGEEREVCVCQNGYHGKFCEKSVFASQIYDYLVSYIPFLATIAIGLGLVTTLTVVTFCIVKRFRKQSFNELKETDVNLNTALEETEQKILNEDNEVDNAEDNEEHLIDNREEIIYEL